MERMISVDTAVNIPEIVPSLMILFKGGGLFAGRKNIICTEWGPYNFNYPFVWSVESQWIRPAT